MARTGTVEIDPAKLRALRKALGEALGVKMTHERLARRMNRNRTTITTLESGAHQPSPALAKQLADALGCSVSDFTIDGRDVLYEGPTCPGDAVIRVSA